MYISSKLNGFTAWRSLRTLRSPIRAEHRLISTGEVLVKPVKIINQPPGSQILITERAAKRLTDIYKDFKEVLKISVESGGCHGFQYNMKLIPNAQVEKELSSQGGVKTDKKGKERDDEDEDFDEDGETNKDVVFELQEDGGKVVVDENSLKVLNQTTLTYSTELIGSTFKISGGNMKSSCGCGSSFDVELEK